MKKTLFLTLFVALFSINSFCQEYLDEDKRFMKITEISNDESYGYSIDNPIKVGSGNGTGAYLNSLKTLDGDKIHIKDMKFDKENGLEMVVLNYEQKPQLETIFFQVNQYETPKAIMGFLYKTIEDIPKVIVFPEDSIVKVTPCSEPIYKLSKLEGERVRNEEISELIKDPYFDGGIEELKKYFAANPLKEGKVTDIYFKVHISFLVTCEGKAGNFKLVSKGRGDLATYANQVLEVVNRMPDKWKPAIINGKPVDCSITLSFTVSEGKLDNVYVK